MPQTPDGHLKMYKPCLTMNNWVLLYSFSLCWTMQVFSGILAQDQWNDTFIGNNEAVLQIKGTEQEYQYQSNRVKARIDREQSRMEFVFPLNSVAPVNNDPVHLEIYNDIFASSVPLFIYLTVPFDEETLTTDVLEQPINLILNGVLTFVDESAQLPVEVSLFSADEDIFYNLATQFNLEQINRPYDGIYREIITGEFGLVMSDAMWRENFNGTR